MVPIGDLADLSVNLISIGAAIGAVIYARVAKGKSEQKIEDRLGEIERWKTEHSLTATTGLNQLTALQAGMSKGAELGFNRVEQQLSKILDATTENAKHISAVSGQVSALAQTVSLLISDGLNDDNRRPIS